MKFTKMHGAGNDYLYIDCFSQKKPGNLRKLAVDMSDRRFGVGSDGIILILPSDRADCRMEMYNSDGSRGAMCGNGIRCVAKYAYDHGIARKRVMTVDTDSGIKTIQVRVQNGKATHATVDMGPPIFERSKVPMRGPGQDGLSERISVLGKTFSANCLSMGNPHCVIAVPDERKFPVERFGPAIQKLAKFPKSVNVEFIRYIKPGEIAQRTWERGAGETYACGTGACAAAVSTILRGRAKSSVLVHLLGGDLQIEWTQGSSVFMTGPAVEVFSAEWKV